MSENVKREVTKPVYVLRGGAYLLDEQAGVLVDSAGNFSAKTKGDPRSLVVMLRAIAEDIEDDVADELPAANFRSRRPIADAQVEAAWQALEVAGARPHLHDVRAALEAARAVS
jgi:hypothetical protein